MPLPIQDLKRHNASLSAELADACREVVESGWYVLGQQVKAFEQEFAAYLGADHCLTVGNGTDALELALRAVGVAAGDEVIAAANDTEYGLVAYVFTNDLRRALRVAEALETGMVGLNQGGVSNPAAPFGGVKQSGLGREGSRHGIEAFTDLKYVCLDAA